MIQALIIIAFLSLVGFISYRKFKAAGKKDCCK